MFIYFNITTNYGCFDDSLHSVQFLLGYIDVDYRSKLDNYKSQNNRYEYLLFCDNR